MIRLNFLNATLALALIAGAPLDLPAAEPSAAVSPIVQTYANDNYSIIQVIAFDGDFSGDAKPDAIAFIYYAFGDASLVLIALAMVIGPLARLWPRATPLLPWRREFGIWGVVAAGVHTVIILSGWIEWDLARLFGFQFHPGLARYVMVEKGFALGNVIGIAALLYGLILAVTSNDLSQRLLGLPIWKFVQQGTYVLWALIVVHTACFLYIHFLDFHRQTPEPNVLQWLFVVLVGMVLSLQIAASRRTWRLRRQRISGACGGHEVPTRV